MKLCEYTEHSSFMIEQLDKNCYNKHTTAQIMHKTCC